MERSQLAARTGMDNPKINREGRLLDGSLLKPSPELDPTVS